MFKALRRAKLHVLQLVRESFQKRDVERNQRIRDLEASGHKADGRVAQRLCRLKKAEDIKQLFRKPKHVKGSKQGKGVTRIEIPLHPADDPKSCDEWQQIDVRTEILRHLQERNRQHFGQAHGTPFTVVPLSDELGFCGNGAATQAILRGKYDSFDLQDNFQLLLHRLKQVEVSSTSVSVNDL